MPDPLLFLWQLIGAESLRFSADSVNRWPDGMFDTLFGLQLLIETDRAQFVACDACGQDHVSRVQWRELSGKSIPVLHCPENGPVRVDIDRLAQWSPNWKSLAKLTAETLRPNLSKECFGRIERGRITADDCASVLELLSGLPSETKLPQRSKITKDQDAEHLAMVTKDMAPQAYILVHFLWSRRYATFWEKLPPKAFRDAQANNDATYYEALRALQKLCTKNVGLWGVTITISKTKRTVELIKSVLPQWGK